MTIWAWPIEVGSVYWYWSEMTAALFQNRKDRESKRAQQDSEMQQKYESPSAWNSAYLNITLLSEIQIYL